MSMSLNDWQSKLHVRRTPISHERVRTFKESFEKKRQGAATVKRLFQRVDAYRSLPGRGADSDTYGYNVYIQKGPFVEGSNWFPHNAWEFVVALERRLIRKLEEVLRESVAGQWMTEIEPSAISVTSTIRSLLVQARSRSLSPSLIAVAGNLGDEVNTAIFSMADHQEMTGGVWLFGAYEGVPILMLREAEEAAIYVAELQRLATLTEHLSSFELDVKEFDATEIADILARDPLKGRPYIEEHVGLQAWESYELRVEDETAVVGAKIRTSSDVHGETAYTLGAVERDEPQS